MAENNRPTMETITNLCKNRGFIFAGSEIYGGLANTWDYGPLGVELKNNVKKAWWKKFIQESPYNVGIDAAILMNPKVWEASGHLAGFVDPLMDCRNCRTRHRADNLIEDQTGTNPTGWENEQMEEFIKENKVQCPNCGKTDFTPIRQFNLMFKTFQGVTEDSQSVIYLRPETAQGIFVNFTNVQRTTRKKIPFGIGQIGKSFRNEITPGNFIFRTREFEQMELQFFCEPGTDQEWFDYWKDFCHEWLKGLNISEEHIQIRPHTAEELSHYSKGTVDFEYLFPFGWGELWGLASRTDYDLTQHQEHSGKSQEYFDQEQNKRYIPYVIEPSLGVERMVLTLLCEAYDEEVLDEESGDVRTVMRFHPTIAPYKAAVLPLSRKLAKEAQEVYTMLSKEFMVTYDDAAAIGRRYRRQDEIGTPYCITYDFDSLEDGMVTVRDRDTMEQDRVAIDKLTEYLRERIAY